MGFHEVVNNAGALSEHGSAHSAQSAVHKHHLPEENRNQLIGLFHSKRLNRLDENLPSETPAAHRCITPG